MMSSTGRTNGGATRRTFAALAVGFMVALIFAPLNETPCLAGEVHLSKGQVVYVPVYSHVQVGNRGLEYNLAATLFVRNTSRVHSISLLSADYYDSQGKLVKRHVTKPVEIAPLASVNFFLKESDVTGGVAPTFLVQWRSMERVTAPVIEAVMIGAAQQQGISILSPGRVLSESE